MDNRYLRDRRNRRDREMRGRDRRMRDREHDMRNPYGSRGGYVRDRRDSRRDYRDYDERGYDREYDGIGYSQDSRDYRDYGDYNDYNDYADYAEEDKEWKEDLKKWSKKLKQKDRFKMNEDELIKRAKNMNVDFSDYDEEEFIAVYYMMISDYPSVSNDPNMYLLMAKNWLEDKDIAVEPSEKLCIYYYEIVKGESK